MSNRRFSGPLLTADRLDSDQQNNARIILNSVNARTPTALRPTVAVIALMTAITEASLSTHAGVSTDHDSGGLFQQRPSAGWGTYDQVRDPTYATNKFLDHLLPIAGLSTIAPWLAAQHVQNSAYSDGSNYEANYADAVSLYHSMGGKGGPVVGSSGNVTAPLKGTPPFAPGVLTDKMTDVQRNKVIDYMGKQAGNPGTPAYVDMVHQLQAFQTHTLLIQYEATITGALPKADPGFVTPGVGPLPSIGDWASGLGKALSWLTSVKNWERVGLFSLGGILLLFATLYLFKQSMPSLEVPL